VGAGGRGLPRADMRGARRPGTRHVQRRVRDARHGGAHDGFCAGASSRTDPAGAARVFLGVLYREEPAATHARLRAIRTSFLSKATTSTFNVRLRLAPTTSMTQASFRSRSFRARFPSSGRLRSRLPSFVAGLPTSRQTSQFP